MFFSSFNLFGHQDRSSQVYAMQGRGLNPRWISGGNPQKDGRYFSGVSRLWRITSTSYFQLSYFAQLLYLFGATEWATHLTWWMGRERKQDTKKCSSNRKTHEKPLWCFLVLWHNSSFVFWGVKCHCRFQLTAGCEGVFPSDCSPGGEFLGRDGPTARNDGKNELQFFGQPPGLFVAYIVYIPFVSMKNVP